MAKTMSRVVALVWRMRADSAAYMTAGKGWPWKEVRHLAAWPRFARGWLEGVMDQ